MTIRLRNALSLGATLLAVGVGLYLVGRASHWRVHAIDALPADAFLVMTLDLAGLRKSPLGAPIVGSANSKLADGKTLSELCGFDPVERMTELAVAVPEDGAPGDYGVAVVADLTRDELVECAKKVLEARRPGASPAASVRSRGTYTLVEPMGEAPAATGSSRYPTLAYRDGGPFLVARGALLGTMIDTVERRLPSARENGEHASLRHALGQLDESATAITFVATTILPKAVRERVRGEMGLDPEGDADHGVMMGVLGVKSAGIGVVAGPPGVDSSILALLSCEAATGCAEVERLLGKKRLEWSQDLSIRLFGMGALLDNARIENVGTSLRVSTHAPGDDAAKWLERVLEVKGVRRRVGPQPTSTAPIVPPLPWPPDETLKPKHDADGEK